MMSAVNGDRGGSVEYFQKYIKELIPEAAIEEEKKEEGMMDVFERFKSFDSEIKVGEGGRIEVRPVEEKKAPEEGQ